MFRRVPRSAPPAPASRGRALRGSARGHPGEGGRRSAQMPRAPAARAAVTTASSCSGRSESPGRIGAIPTPTSMPASASARIARRRLAGGAVPGSVVRQTRSSSVGRETYTLTGTSRAAAWRTSMSRTISGPRVTMESGVPDAASSRMHERVSRNRASAGWYGSVAVPSATSSCFQEGRASSRRSTSATFGLMRIDRPYRSSDGRSARCSKCLT